MGLIVPGLGALDFTAEAQRRNADDPFVPTSLVSLTLMGVDGDPVEVEITDLSAIENLAGLAPVRAPMPYHGQRHLPAFYFSVTQEQHLFAESRLEEAWLLILDWAQVVHSVIAQPLTMVVADDAGETATHTPDLLVLSAGAPVIANVRPAALTDRASFVRGQAGTAWLADQLGWDTAVLTEPPPLLVRNLRWLRNFARPMWGTEEAQAEVLDLVGNGEASSVGEVRHARGADPFTVPAVMHLLWHQTLTTALHRPIDHDSPLTISEVGNA